jgi:hypothetical protein
VQYTAWVLGFLSAWDMAKHDRRLETTDADSIDAWMDNYCASKAYLPLAVASLLAWGQIHPLP